MKSVSSVVKRLVSKDKDGFIVYSSHKAIAESKVCSFKFSEMISQEGVLISNNVNPDFIYTFEDFDSFSALFLISFKCQRISSTKKMYSFKSLIIL